MKNEKTVKNILFRLNIEGEGIVNFDSKDQKYMYNGTGLRSKYGYSHNNVQYAKKNFYFDKDGELSFKLKISSDCIRHEIFAKDVLNQSPNIISNEFIYYSYIASPAMILRGYLFTDKKYASKRKSAITLTAAEQTNNAVSHLETHSTSSVKTEKDTELDESDNTFFLKESVGKIEYSSKGNIDIMQLSFISLSELFDRLAFNPDKYDLFEQFLKLRMPMFDSKPNYYLINGSISDVPELGIKFNDECINIFVREFFKKIMSFYIGKKDSYARTKNVQFKYVYDCIEDTFDSEEGWLDLPNSEDEIDKISFNPHSFYGQQDFSKSMEIIEGIKQQVERTKDTKKQKQKEEKEAKAASKSSKITKKDEIV